MAIVVAVAGAGDVVEGGLRSILREARDLEVMDEFPHFGVIPDVVVYDARVCQPLIWSTAASTRAKSAMRGMRSSRTPGSSRRTADSRSKSAASWSNCPSKASSH